jgi:hypothetical protein
MDVTTGRYTAGSLPHASMPTPRASPVNDTPTCILNKSDIGCVYVCASVGTPLFFQHVTAIGVTAIGVTATDRW